MKRDCIPNLDTLPCKKHHGLDTIDADIAEVMFEEIMRGQDRCLIPSQYRYRAGVDPLKDTKKPKC